MSDTVNPEFLYPITMTSDGSAWIASGSEVDTFNISPLERFPVGTVEYRLVEPINELDEDVGSEVTTDLRIRSESLDCLVMFVNSVAGSTEETDEGDGTAEHPFTCLISAFRVLSLYSSDCLRCRSLLGTVNIILSGVVDSDCTALPSPARSVWHTEIEGYLSWEIIISSARGTSAEIHSSINANFILALIGVTVIGENCVLLSRGYNITTISNGQLIFDSSGIPGSVDGCILHLSGNLSSDQCIDSRLFCKNVPSSTFVYGSSLPAGENSASYIVLQSPDHCYLGINQYMKNTFISAGGFSGNDVTYNGTLLRNCTFVSGISDSLDTAFLIRAYRMIHCSVIEHIYALGNRGGEEFFPVACDVVKMRDCTIRINIENVISISHAMDHSSHSVYDSMVHAEEMKDSSVTMYLTPGISLPDPVEQPQDPDDEQGWNAFYEYLSGAGSYIGFLFAVETGIMEDSGVSVFLDFSGCQNLSVLTGCVCAIPENAIALRNCQFRVSVSNLPEKYAYAAGSLYSNGEIAIQQCDGPRFLCGQAGIDTMSVDMCDQYDASFREV